MPFLAGQNRMRRIGKFPSDARRIQNIASHRFHFCHELLARECRFEINRDLRIFHRTQHGAELINRTTLKPVSRNEQLTHRVLTTGADDNVLERLALCYGKCLRRPRMLPAAIRRNQRPTLDATRREAIDP